MGSGNIDDVWRKTNSHQSDPGGLAVFGSTLFYISNGRHAKDIRVVACDLSAADIEDASAWLNYELPGNMIKFYDNKTPQTDSGIAALVVDGRLFCFWSDTGSDHDDNCYASYLSDASFTKNAVWNEHIRLYESADGDSRLTVPNGPLVAFEYGGLICLLSMESDQKSIIFQQFDPAAITGDERGATDQDIDWKPERSARIKFSDLDDKFSNFRKDDEGTQRTFSADWATDGIHNYLMLGLYDGDDECINLPCLKLDEDGMPTMHGLCRVIDGAHDGVCVRRDPSGRVRVYYGDDDHELNVATVDTGAGMEVSTTKYSGFEIAKSASVTFRVEQPTASQDIENAHEAKCNEIVFYSDRSHDDYGNVIIKKSYYGTQVSDFESDTVDYSAIQGSVPYVLESLIDAFPLPNEATADIREMRELVDITYGATESKSSSHQVTESLGFGVKSDGKITIASGTGHWDLKFSAGPTSAGGESERTVNVSNMVGWTIGGNGEIDPRGALFYTGIKMTRDDYYMLDANGNRVVGAPEFSAFYPLKGIRQTDAYQVYTSIPGDLDSYKRGSINERMDQLFPIGCEYREEFGSWNDYVAEVIEAHAVPLGENGEKPIQIAIGPTGDWSSTFQEIASEFTETGWEMTEEAYIGLGVDLSIKDPATEAVKFGAEFKAMIGVTYSMKNTWREDTEDSWGISYTLTSSAHPLSITEHYTVLMYLLPASNRWTAELKAAVKAGVVQLDDAELIDPASQPSRIVFVVV